MARKPVLLFARWPRARDQSWRSISREIHAVFKLAGHGDVVTEDKVKYILSPYTLSGSSTQGRSASLPKARSASLRLEHLTKRIASAEQQGKVLAYDRLEALALEQAIRALRGNPSPTRN
jgi:hypothetical protein